MVSASLYVTEQFIAGKAFLQMLLILTQACEESLCRFYSLGP